MVVILLFFELWMKVIIFVCQFIVMLHLAHTLTLRVPIFTKNNVLVKETLTKDLAQVSVVIRSSKPAVDHALLVIVLAVFSRLVVIPQVLFVIKTAQQQHIIHPPQQVVYILTKLSMEVFNRLIIGDLVAHPISE